MVVAMGGDGTVSEVVNGFFRDREPVNEEAVLGILPFGTGGDLVRSLNLPTRLSAAAAALKGRDLRVVDVGVLDCDDECGRGQTLHFINVASFGIGGLVDTLVNESPKVLGGTLSFMLGTLRAAAVYENCPLKLELDGEREIHLTALNVAVANGQFFGGGMHIAPWARLDDGLFDVVALGDFSPWELVTRGHRIYRGTHLGHPKVRFDRARHIRAMPVDPNREVLLDVDGETPGRLPASFEVIPKSLRIKVSGGSA